MKEEEVCMYTYTPTLIHAHTWTTAIPMSAWQLLDTQSKSTPQACAWEALNRFLHPSFQCQLLYTSNTSINLLLHYLKSWGIFTFKVSNALTSLERGNYLYQLSSNFSCVGRVWGLQSPVVKAHTALPPGEARIPEQSYAEDPQRDFQSLVVPNYTFPGKASPADW